MYILIVMAYYLPPEIIDKISYFQCDVQNFQTIDLSEQSKEIWIEKYTSGSFILGNMVSHIFLVNLSIVTHTLKTKISLIPLCTFNDCTGLWFTGTEFSRLPELLELRRHVIENLGNFTIEFKSSKKTTLRNLFYYQPIDGLLIQTSDGHCITNDCIIKNKDHILQIINKLISYTESADKFLMELKSKFRSNNGDCYNKKRMLENE